MPANNRSAHPFYIIVGTMTCLLALSLVNNSFSLQGFSFRRVDLLADIKRDIPVPKPVQRRVIVKQPVAVKPAEPATDTLENIPARPVYDFMTYTGIQEYYDSTVAGMQHFLAALHDLKAGKRKKVRIAYFGDSMVEGDLITEDLRDSLQSRFGGAGVGFVPVTSIVAPYRFTIRHTFSDNWKDYHFKNNPDKMLLGLSGHTFMPEAASWAKYTPVAKPGLDHFSEVSVFYGPAAGNDNNVIINGKAYTLSGTALVNELALQQDRQQKSVYLEYPGDTPLPFYGLSFESGQGIFVDNYAFRGISGIELGQLGRRMLEQMQQRHPYDLVVLHYGANVLFRPELTDYNWYGQLMKKVVDSLRYNWPHTSFLIIGTADKSYKKDDHFITAPGVPALLKVQHELAEDHGAAYWNLYAAMGGDGAMARWVEGDPILGKKDHTHFTYAGATLVGALLFKAMIDEYNQEAHP